MDEITNESRNMNEDRKNESDPESPQFLDLTGIHWGYLNCWQSVIRGKKSKVDSWYTYWVDLCASTMRLYKDKSLPPDSINMPPSASVVGPLPENEQKFAFFGLKDATVELISDLNLYPKKLKPADFTRIFRRHLFQIVFTKLNSTYVFQAPSNSSMLRWVSKIQEAIAISQNEQFASAAVDEQMKVANFLLEQRRLRKNENITSKKQKVDLAETEEEEMKKPTMQDVSTPKDPKLIELQEILKEKTALYKQLCLQEEQFLGGESEQEISGGEITGTTKQDYYLVPGRIETFVCKGTKMTLFGQLPNRRWRCWVEIDEVIKAMNSLIAESACNDLSKEDNHDDADTRLSLLDKNKEIFKGTTEKYLMARSYPIIGAIPTSLVQELKDVYHKNKGNQTHEETTFISDTPPANSPTEELENYEEIHNDNDDYKKEELSAVPYSSHARRTPRKTNSQLSIDSFFFTKQDDLKSLNHEQSFNHDQSPNKKKISGSLPRLQTSPFYQEDIKFKFDDQQSANNFSADACGSASSAASSLPIIQQDTPSSTPSDSPVTGVRRRENGFIIKKRLRQKGISIIVGSSSSEDDDSDEDTEKKRQNELKDDIVKQTDSHDLDRPEKKRKSLQLQAMKPCEENNFNQETTTNKEKNLNKARSNTTLPGKLTANTELLDQFGLRSASIGNAETAKLFPKFKGPDVKPPRNERRTLKLSKHPDKGYGFYLQTFVFTQANGDKDRKTFVRYVEEEGPAYMSGLREGDVIVEIDGEEVNNKDHAQLVNVIKNSDRELLLVVKFIDAMKRAELCIKLKKKKAKLRSRLREYEELCSKENDFQQLSMEELNSMKRSDSTTSSGIGLSDDSSDNLASSNEQVIIQTSRFEERSSTVFDSVKEIRYSEDTFANNNNNTARTHITTSFDLLSDFSTGVALKDDNDKKPVRRSRSFSGSGSKEEHDTTKTGVRKNSKDDGFITGVPSLTKSRPPAKIISNRNSLSDNTKYSTSIKTFQNHQQLFYNPAAKDRSTLPVKTRPVTPKKDRTSGLPVKDYTPGKTSTLSNPSRDRLLSRNSRPKSYKMAVTTGAQGGKRTAERILSYDQIKSRGAPETDL